MSDKPYVPAESLSKLWRALIEFDMLSEGDKILIGLSGGKDSMFLTAALAEAQKYSPVKFELACYTVDGMFSPAFPEKELQAFCAVYGLKHYHEKVNVMEAWQNKGNTPCFTCAFFRRGATNRKAKELGFDFIQIINQDGYFDDATVSKLIEVCKQDKEIAYAMMQGMIAGKKLADNSNTQKTA